jgi:glycosyltransferase involved in cell wall biosynthesis
MKVTFISTVFNEEENIDKLLDSLLEQSKNPDEVIITDGGSNDKTIAKIKDYEARFKKKNVVFKLLIKKGNRSVGRNTAIKYSTGDVIACSDAGCVLDKNWLKNITEPFNNSATDVVSGYSEGLPANIFQKCLITYVLIMPDKIDHDNFLPAARSMAFRKKLWQNAGGFPENFSDNEDYVFARKLKEMDSSIVFRKHAMNYWLPRKNIKEAFVMFYRFASGDAEAGIFRPKVVLIFARYLIGFIIASMYLSLRRPFILYSLCFILFMYICWATAKNYRYIKSTWAFLYLPFIQVLSDIAVIIGTVRGVIKYGI